MVSLSHVLAATVIRVWLSTSSQSWRRLPRPRGEPVVNAPGPNPDRILVVGSGAVVGYGVLSHDLSVNGQLARLVAATTGRGVDLRILADPDLDVRAARRELEKVRLDGFDVIVVTVGSLDALQLLPRREWGAQLGLLLDSIRARAGRELRILVMGIPPLTALVPIPRPFRTAVRKRCDALNSESAHQIASRPGVAFVPFTPPEIDLMQNASREVHTVWARIIAPSVVGALQQG